LNDAARAVERDPALERTLARMREDMSDDAASQFAALALDYLKRAAAGDGAVSPATATVARADRPSVDGGSLDTVLRDVERAVVAGANRLWHPMYMGHQVAPPLPAAIWTEPLIAALNQSIAVREMSPAATPIELALIKWMCGLVWPNDAPRVAGTFTSGGTEAIFTSLLAARNAALPDAVEAGLRGPAAIVCGEHAHYAVKRAAGQLGLGASGAVQVASKEGRMDVAELERTLGRLRSDDVPVVAVVATAGTTATGAFDELVRIGEVCARRGIWLHVDAAHGGSALLSVQHRGRLDGIAHARSVSWDAHKMMLMPLPAGVVLMRDGRALEGAFGQNAPYLFRSPPAGGGDPDPDEQARVADQGLRSFMCSRRADAVKVWVALERYGVSGIAALYDALCERTRELHGLLRAHAGFETMHEPECNILCFRWVGSPRVAEDEVDALNLALRELWNVSGDGWITSTVLEGRRVLRVVLMNPLTETEHLRRLVDGLAALATRLPSGTAGRARTR
jgi:L-2,4-diaminobutyrate decarboxylase